MEHMACGLKEIKFDSGGAESMTFSGYGAVFGNVDHNGDVIVNGAFSDALAVARRTGNWPALLSQHGGWGMTAGDLVPVGIITDLAEDGRGLKMEAKLADTPRGLEYYRLMKMKPRPAINGLSIGYIAKEWTPRSKPDEPRRTLKKVDLIEISLVTFPANPKALVRQVKAIDKDLETAIDWLGKAIDLHEGHMDGSVPTSEESQQEMMDMMKNAYAALTSRKKSGGMKSCTEREFERYLMQDAGMTRSEARIIISRGFKALTATQDAGSVDDETAEALLRLECIIKPK